MKTSDMRFDMGIIRGWLGKVFVKYKCDAFDFTNSVTQIVGLYVGEEVFALTNKQELVDYFGTDEDIAISKLFKAEENQIKSAFKSVEMISTPIEEKITAIKIVNERQKLTKNGVVTHDVWLTRAVVIEAGGREISFEKDVVPFSEEITIRRGYDLVNKCADESEFLDGWDNNLVPECTREVIEITEK